MSTTDGAPEGAGAGGDAAPSGFWYAEWTFPLLVASLAASVFAGTHLYYVYGTGIFNDIAVVALLRAGMEGGGYGAAAAFGTGFLVARVIEGPMVGILDIGGSIQTGIGVGLPAMILGAGFTLPLENFWLSLLVGAVAGAAIGTIVILIRRYTVNSSAVPSTFGAGIMMGAGNSAGRYLGPLIIIAAATASIPIGIGATAGALLFYLWHKPLTGGAILGAMAIGVFFPLSS
ncbi:DUF4310 family protein [Nocardiopsis mangrovi]|uniref:DUF4310 family protein n=1 Tax=Nocardiopsis mangrovi TaxID=1179818 RepID=A0ABV9E1M2_9ACTN